MSRDEIRKEMLDAVESDAGFAGLREVVEGRLRSGDSKDVFLGDLSAIRQLVDEVTEESVLDVMDVLVGWCAASARLGDEVIGAVLFRPVSVRRQPTP